MFPPIFFCLKSLPKFCFWVGKEGGEGGGFFFCLSEVLLFLFCFVGTTCTPCSSRGKKSFLGIFGSRWGGENVVVIKIDPLFFWP